MLSYRKCMGFLINFPQCVKLIQIAWYGESQGNWYFSQSIGAFSLLDSHPVEYFKICGMHGLPHQSPIAWENTAKSLELGEPGKLLPSFWPKYFSHSRFPILKYTLPHEKWMAFPIISNSMGKCNKIHPGSYQLAFSQNYCFYLFQNLVIPEKNKQKKLIR